MFDDFDFRNINLSKNSCTTKLLIISLLSTLDLTDNKIYGVQKLNVEGGRDFWDTGLIIVYDFKQDTGPLTSRI